MELFDIQTRQVKEDLISVMINARAQKYLLHKQLKATDKSIKKGRHFAEYLLRNKKGGLVFNHPAHEEIQDFVEWSWDNGKWVLVECAMGIGKTEQVVISKIVELLTDDPELTIAIVSEADDPASKRVQSINEYMNCEAEKFGLVIEEENKHSLKLRRKNKSKDPTLQGFGINSSATGGRFDYIILDDIETIDNVILKNMSVEIWESFNLKWSTRLVKGGKLAVVNTKYIENGPIDKIEKDSRFNVIKIRVNKDYESFTCEKYIDGKLIESKVLPPWENYKSKDELKQMDNDPLNHRLFCLAYTLEVGEVSLQKFKDIIHCEIDSNRMNQMINEAMAQKRAVFIRSVDLSGMNRAGSVILNSVLILGSDGKTQCKIHREAKYLKMNWLELRNEIIRQEEDTPAYWIIEGNGMQDNLIPIVREKWEETKRLKGIERNINLIIHITGRNKNSIDQGVENMNVYFEKKEELFNVDDPGVCQIVNEFKSYGIRKDTFDGLMACWFINVNAGRFTKKLSESGTNQREQNVYYSKDNFKKSAENYLSL